MAATQPRRRQRKNITTPELPLDVIFSNILPRLPARSVMKYLSVSKQWYSFLKSPNFVNMHLNFVTNDDRQNHHKLLVLYKYGVYNIRDCETHKPGMPRRRPLPFEVNSRDVHMKSTCNGLVLVSLEEEISRIRDLILWNPLTGDYKTLSKTIECYNTKFELYYNSTKKDYRILLLSHHKDVYIYSLKSDSWRRIDPEDAFQCFPNTLPHLWSPSVCWFENLYFKYYYNDYLIRFDTKTEKFTQIEIPFKEYKECSRITVQRDCIHMCAQKDNAHIELWKMNKIGHWEQVSTYEPVRDTERFLHPLHLMRDGYWIMMKSYKTVYTVDLENKHNKDNKDSPLPYNLKGSVEGVYIETLVSPNQYFNRRTQHYRRSS